MPSDLAVSVRGLSKAYQISHNDVERQTTLTETTLHRLRRPFARPTRETFWALKDVSFEVRKGDVVGIIGRNGAGKSTLLKILSRITEPTDGTIDVYGRVGSLLEVGTGFHPEFTGRENIYLNGQILGMRRKEITRQFDAIVDFAEIEQFIDTPVKRYSSGMYVRLAFAVAAHLNPEILVVDEVLAVGDVAFQKKCLGKMQQVAEQEGRTVLFVSHNMAAIQNLCTRAVLMSDGEVSFIGAQDCAIAEYLKSGNVATVPVRDRADRRGSGDVRVVGIRVTDDVGNVLHDVSSGQNVELRLDFETAPRFAGTRVIASIMLRTQMAVPVFLQHNRLRRVEFGPLPRSGSFVCDIRRLPIPPGIYALHFSLSVDGDILDAMDDAVELQVVPGDFFGSGDVPPATHGLCLVDADWRVDVGKPSDSNL